MVPTPSLPIAPGAATSSGMNCAVGEVRRRTHLDPVPEAFAPSCALSPLCSSPSCASATKSAKAPFSGDGVKEDEVRSLHEHEKCLRELLDGWISHQKSLVMQMEEVAVRLHRGRVEPETMYAPCLQHDASPKNSVFNAMRGNEPSAKKKAGPLATSNPEPCENVQFAPRLRLSTLSKPDLLSDSIYQSNSSNEEFTPSEASSTPCAGAWPQRLVSSVYFDLVCTIAIIVSAVLVGAEIDYRARNNGVSHDIFLGLDISITIYFVFELLVRGAASGRSFFHDAERLWNMFDVLIIGFTGVDIVVTLAMRTAGAERSGNYDFMKLLRLFRILRILRLTRALRLKYVPRELRKMCFAVQHSAPTLLWSMLLLILVMYTFGVFFTESVSNYLNNLDHANHTDELQYFIDIRHYYGTLPRTIDTLFMSIFGGISWVEVADPLAEIHVAFKLVFVIYISLLVVGILNVVIAIFVESALDSAHHYKDLLITENLQQRQLFCKHLRSVFHAIDIDNSGALEMDEVEQFLKDPTLNQYLQSIDVFPNDARALFRLLDTDGSGEIDLEEFTEGCLRLKGDAKSFDVHCMIYENKRFMTKWSEFMEYMEQLVVQAMSGHGTAALQASQSTEREATKPTTNDRAFRLLLSRDGCRRLADSKPASLLRWQRSVTE